MKEASKAHQRNKEISNANEEQTNASNQQLRASEQQLQAANQQLKANEQQLRAANQQLTASEKDLRIKNHDLEERLKEINCLYKIGKIVRQNVDIDDLLQNIVKEIPPGWHYPEITVSRILYNERSYISEQFEETKWKQYANLIIDGDNCGAIEVYYLNEMPILDEGPFLKEERNLIDSLAEIVSSAIEKINKDFNLQVANQQLMATEQQLRASNQQLAASEQQLRATNQQLAANEQQLRVTNQQLIEESKKLQASKKEIKTIFNATASGLRVVAPDFKIMKANHTFLKMVGLSEEEVIGRNCYDVFMGKFCHTENCPINKLQQSKKNRLEFEIVKKRPDGKEIPTIKISTGLKENNGKIIGIIEEYRDMTEYKKADLKLKESETRYRELVDTVNSGVAIYKVINKGRSGSDYIIQDFNQFALQHEQMQKKDVIGKSLKDIRPTIDDYGLIETFREVWKTGKPAFFPAKVYVDEKYSHYYENRVFKLLSGEIVAIYDDVTDHEISRTRLTKSEAKFRSYINNAPDGIFVADENGNYLEVNQAICKITGYSEKELQQKSFNSTLQKSYLERSNQYFLEVLEKGTASGELGFVTKNGENRFWEIAATKLSATRLLVFVKDITKRKNAEDALRKSQRDLNELVMNSPVCIKKIDLDFNLQFMSDPGIKQLKIDKIEDFYGKPYPLYFFPEKFKAEMSAKMQEVRQTGNLLEIEGKLSDAKGKKLWYHHIIAPVLDDQGKIEYLLIVSMDISERKQAEFQNVALLEIIKRSNDFVGLAYFDNKAFFVNSAGQKMVGLDSDEAASRTKIEDYFLEEDLPFLRKEIFPKLMREGRWAGEYRFRHFKTGEPIEIYYDLFRTKDPKTEEVINIGTITKDISKQKAYEKELIAAKEKAEESDRLKSAFLANMSHEIRTPMNGILGFTSLLKESVLSGEKQKKYIDIIDKSGQRILNTIQNIIDISKIESGIEKISISEINLNKHMDDLFDFFLPETQQKNIHFTINKQLPENKANIKTDFDKLNSILTNLIKNAIKYTNNGSIEFGYCLNTDKKNQVLKIYVKDTGIGIPKNRQEAVFNRFEQADIEDRSAYQGSGLGLAIVKAYSEMLGGKICLESEPGIGSVFYLTIPYYSEK